MIIQCEQCRTKFRLDDEKVSDRGVKVRCAKCRHIFTVRKDAEQTAPTNMVAPVTAPMPAFESSDETVRMTVTPAAEPEVNSSASEPAVAFDFGAAPTAASSFDLGQTDAAAETGFDFGDVSFSTEPSATAPVEADFGEMTMVMPPKQTVAPVGDFNLDFGEALASGTATQQVSFDLGDQPATTPAADINLGGFDFGEAAEVAPAMPTDIDATDFSDFAAPAAASKAASSGLGFSFDDVAPQSEATAAGSFDFSGVDFGSASPSTTAHAPEVDAFSLGEMDFSGDTVAVMVDSATSAPIGALFAPVEEAVAQQQVAATPAITFEAPATAEEAPPLAISSRRRQSSSFSILIGIITVLVVGVLGYMAYTLMGDGPKAGAPVEDGKLTVQNVKAYFIPKAAAGELLVITGDALNGFKAPRAALQVKGTVLGVNNQPLATKTAYAGNQLTKEQLASMPAEKIEAAMNNQFGDSLVNMGVQPGKTIPFTIVIINPPKEGKEFGVEPAASTVAAGDK